MRKFGYLFAGLSMMIVGDVFAGTRYIYVQAQPVQQNQSLDGVQRVIRDMAALRPATASRSLASDKYHQDLDARLRALETKNNIASPAPRAIGAVGAAVVTELAVSAAADILGALNLNKNSSDQDKAQAILEALIPHLQVAQQAAAANAVQNANTPVPGLTEAEVKFLQALQNFIVATDSAQKDSDERKKLLEGQKKKIDELLAALKKLSP